MLHTDSVSVEALALYVYAELEKMQPTELTLAAFEAHSVLGKKSA